MKSIMTYSPISESQIHTVNSFQELISTSFHHQINAIGWTRKLIGDFAEIINKVQLDHNITTLTEEELRGLELSTQGKLARKVLLNDMQMLEDYGGSPTLNLIQHYDRDTSFPFFPTDVYSYHVDRSPIPVETFLCTYHGDSSDILPNSQAQQKILIPEIRAELKTLYNGTDQGFESFLSEYFFDLHYQANPQSDPTNLGVGHLWKLAVDHPKSNVLPCIHRAPKESSGKTRLLMIC